MFVTLKGGKKVAKLLVEILGIPECRCLKIVAGHNGLERQVSWTSAIEVVEIIRFSNEGDLNFVTGLRIASDDDFISIVREAYKYKMAGIVFALGPYITEIPKSVLEFGNSYDFPIIIMPWEVKISTLSHTIGEFISAEISRNPMPIDILKSILIGGEDVQLTSELRRQLRSSGFTEDCQYQVLLFEIVKRGENAEERLKEICEKLGNGIRRLYFGEAIIQMDTSIVVILRGHATKKVLDEKEKNEIENLATNTQMIVDDFYVRVGIGNQYNKIEQITNSYREARLVTKLISAEVQHCKNLYLYDQLGVYKVIWESRNSEVMVKFSEEILGTLKAYDDINGTGLLNFLIAYFRYNGNNMDISKNLFLHKNTVLYKLHKIEGILGCNFAQQETILNLKLALMIREVFNDK